ncbi:MAG: peptidase C1 [Lentimicrobium sp.]|nr:peptidase C1 [Lentimicrobium sp.]
MKKQILLGGVLLIIASASAQNNTNSKGVFKFYEPGYYQNSILKGIEKFESTQETVKQSGTFKMDPSGIAIPTDKNTFKSIWHLSPVSQGNTNTCWSYSATSMFESEIYRLTRQEIKLSEMYTAYCEYIERAVQFVRTRGKIYIGEGSEMNAVIRVMKKYGTLPYSSYSGLLPGQEFQSHEKMFNEIKAYLDGVKTRNAWDEATVVSTVKSIMHHYIGEPPARVNVQGKEYTPQQYLSEILRINPNDYIDVLSIMQQPYWKQVVFEVPDNWWNDASYYNIPLDDYMKILMKALKSGITVSIAGDVSEAGFLAREANAAMIPSFDIPSAAIDENARQFRFSNGTTTDDHGMHVVGYQEKDGTAWFLFKDSGAGSRTGGPEKNPNFGYYFVHEDYIRLKMMTFLVNKEVMKDLLPMFR